MKGKQTQDEDEAGSNGGLSVEGVETVDEVPEDAKAGAKSGESGAVNAGNTKEAAVSSAVSSYETARIHD